jgi:hypothetical protein
MGEKAMFYKGEKGEEVMNERENWYLLGSI